jgi:2-oxoglutarate dehydrogenase complex dihydrolipoamide succinyltransferase (E2) component
MPVNVIMPHMGESVVEGTITSWLKQPGDSVEEDEPLCEIETDKINVEVPAPSSGVLLKVMAEEGETVEVDETIAVIGEDGEKVEEAEAPAEEKDEAPPEPKEPQEAEEKEGQKEEQKEQKEAPPKPEKKAPPPPRQDAEEEGPPTGSGVSAEKGPVQPGKLGVLASPAVRRFAREMGVDLGEVDGSGRMGRITKDDVKAHVEQQKEAEAEAKEAEATGEEAPAPKRKAPDVDEELVPLTKMRKAVAEHMVRSKSQAPHVTTVAEADMTAVAELRKQWKPRFAEQDVRLTYTVFILNAVARALHDYPELNSQWTDDGILIKYRINLGLAVAVEDGLVVPVIRDADRMDLLELARAVQSVAEKTRGGKVSASDVQGGTFTLTNPGVFGAVLSTPIIHQPQAAILATGRIADVPAVVDGGIAVRKRMYLSLSYDHRIVDGATAVKFLQRVRELLEDADFESP